MGDPLHLMVKMVTADCEDELVWTAQGVDQACPEAPTVNKFQVTASFQQKSNNEFAAHLSVCDNANYWSPPIRTGYGWKDYLEYDLYAVASLKKVQIGRPSLSNRDI